MYISELNRNSRSPSWIRRALIGAFAATTFAGSASCTNTECGEGTIERDDECVPADGISPETNSCGPGTVYSPGDGACISSQPPTECGPNTVEEIGDDGEIVCVGAGGGTCDGPISCPQPDANRATVCGQIIDIETGDPVVEGDGSDTSECVTGSPTADGPCSLEIQLYAALQVATDPQEDWTALQADEVVIDKCGRFRIANTTAPVAPDALGILIDDNRNGTSNAYSFSGFAQYVTPGGRVTGRPLVATRRATDEAWTQAAGDPFDGRTFTEKGVAFMIFNGNGGPAPGVRGTIMGSVNDNSDYYFAAGDTTWATLDPVASATGANGTVLLVDVGVNNISGEGGEPNGCTWRSDLAASPVGVLFYTDRVSQNSGGDACP